MALAPLLFVHFGGAQLFSNQHNTTAKDATQKGTTKWIPVSAFEHRVSSEQHVLESKAAKKLTGKRSHAAFMIQKKVDVTSPVFYQLLLDGKLDSGKKNQLSRFELQLVDIAPNKPNNWYSSIALVGATVISIEAIMPDYGDQSLRNQHEYEEIWFAYDEIEFKHQTLVKEKVEEGKSGRLFVPDWIEESLRVQVYEGLAKLDK